MGRTISKSTRNASIIEFTCDNVEDFLDTISLNGSVMKTFEMQVSPCIFRGVSSSDYLLVPTALRNDIRGWEHFEFVDGHDHFQGQILWEQHLLRSFFHLADVHGLHIPEDGQALRHSAERLATYEYVDEILMGRQLWPPDEMLSLIGIAQHFGLPTRLLDWTRDPFVAAYFAASGATRCEPSPKDSLAVWVMNLATRASAVGAIEGRRRITEKHSNSNHILERQSIEDVILVSSPAALNARLHAQQGLFTLYRPSKIDLGQSVHNVSLDDYIQPPLPKSDEDSQLF